jgi:hypothetical protein
MRIDTRNEARPSDSQSWAQPVALNDRVPRDTESQFRIVGSNDGTRGDTQSNIRIAGFTDDTRRDTQSNIRIAGFSDDTGRDDRSTARVFSLGESSKRDSRRDNRLALYDHGPLRDTPSLEGHGQLQGKHLSPHRDQVHRDETVWLRAISDMEAMVDEIEEGTELADDTSVPESTGAATVEKLQQGYWGMDRAMQKPRDHWRLEFHEPLPELRPDIASESLHHPYLDIHLCEVVNELAFWSEQLKIQGQFHPSTLPVGSQTEHFRIECLTSRTKRSTTKKLVIDSRNRSLEIAETLRLTLSAVIADEVNSQSICPKWMNAEYPPHGNLLKGPFYSLTRFLARVDFGNSFGNDSEWCVAGSIPIEADAQEEI